MWGLAGPWYPRHRMTFPPSFPLQTVASEPADKGKMRQRVTFLLEDDHDSKAPPINVTSNSVKVNVIGAAKEHQLSISLDDLPRQVQDVPRRDLFHGERKAADSISPFVYLSRSCDMSSTGARSSTSDGSP